MELMVKMNDQEYENYKQYLKDSRRCLFVVRKILDDINIENIEPELKYEVERIIQKIKDEIIDDL